MDDETHERLSEDASLPFEVRCHHAYEYHRRTWPGGEPVTASQEIRWRMFKDSARRIDFVRVDLYDADRGVVFGKLINYPWGGAPTWDRPFFDESLGSWWHLHLAREHDGRRSGQTRPGVPVEEVEALRIDGEP